MGLGLSCSYLIFLVVIAMAEAVSSDPAPEKLATIAALALFIAGYIAFWWTSMTEMGWTCEPSWLRIGLAVGLWAITLALCLVHFQVFGYMLIFAAAVVSGLFSGRAAVLALVAVLGVSVAFISATRSSMLEWFWLPVIVALTGLGTMFG